MPNIKSAKKRVLVIAKKTLQNKMVMTNLRTCLKKFDAAVEAGNKEEAMAAYLNQYGHEKMEIYFVETFQEALEVLA